MASCGDDLVHARLSSSNLIAAADHYANSLPVFAAYLMSEAERRNACCGFTPTSQQRMCVYCGSLFRPDNHYFRCASHKSNKKNVKKIQKKFEAGKHLSKFNRMMLKRSIETTTDGVLHCNICNKKTKIACLAKPKRNAVDESSSQTTEVSISKAMKKRLKRKKRLRLSNLSDSGLDLSIDSGKEVMPNLTSTPIISKHKGVASLFGSTSVNLDKPVLSMYSNNSSLNLSQSTGSSGPGSDTFTSLANTSVSSQGNTSVSKRSNKKARDKLKNNKLHHILTQEKKKKDQASGSSLQSFLASL